MKLEILNLIYIYLKEPLKMS